LWDDLLLGTAEVWTKKTKTRVSLGNKETNIYSEGKESGKGMAIRDMAGRN